MTEAKVAEAFRTWWKAQKARDNYGEFVQAILRVAIGVVLLSAYYAWVDWSKQTWVRYLCWGFVALSFLLFAWIYRAKQSSDVVRFVTLAVDMGTPTILLGLTGERSAILVFVYTWVAVGHGFRFGLRYLHVAWIVSLLAFVLVYALSAAVHGFWYEHPLVWLGAFFWVGAPTFYVARLLKQKLVAVLAAEEARVQAERAEAEAERERVERARAEAERARAEAEAASEAKSDFLATMSHEMRTPLNGVVGAAELLAAKELPQKERQLVDWLLTSSRQLRSLIDNLLDLRKIEAGKIVIEREPLDLHVLMNRLAALFEPEAKRTHLRFTKSVSVKAPYMLIGDDLRIQQVLINLTANALKFTHEGFVRISASALEEADHQVVIRFEVRDTGIGIAPENTPRIFDRFTQANPGIQRQYGGSGLGTTICKHLVELMGGAIGFESQPRNGTTFWFTVPLSRQPAQLQEDGIRAQFRDVRLCLLSGRPGTGGCAAQLIRDIGIPYGVTSSVDAVIADLRQDQSGEACVVVVDGEDQSVHWRDVPTSIRGAGSHTPCLLLHSDVDERDAFDAGYATLLGTREPRLLRRAIRSAVAGTSAQQPLADDIPGRQLVKGAGSQILVAEDNQVSQQIIAMILESGGHHVTLVSDGDSVLERYRGSSFDLLILDMHMPGRTGLEAARAIRTSGPAEKTPRVPIIMLTAAASTDLREDSLDAGIDLFLSKPVDPRALLSAVNQTLTRARTAPIHPSPGPEERETYVDRVLLHDMAELASDSRFVQTLTSTFARDAAQLLAEIEAALLQRDSGKFKELAHALKGAAMMAGAVRLGEIAARAERIAVSDFARGGIDLIADLKKTLEATNHELARMIA
jgi:two-component system sensor histidine kinase RpfC